MVTIVKIVFSSLFLVLSTLYFVLNTLLSNLKSPIYHLFSIAYFLLPIHCFFAQSSTNNFQSTISNLPSNTPDPQSLFDQAIGKYIENGNVAMEFEAIAFGLQSPEAIFSLPKEQLLQHAFYYLDAPNHEIQLGIIKSMSDGNLMVLVDEISKTMFVDSIRNTANADSLLPAIASLVNENFGEVTLSYVGEENINQRACYKLKATYTQGENTHVLYWIEKATQQLYLMAEYQSDGYQVYWFKSIGIAPKNHEYSINLPKKELESYYGYEVIDNRFLNEQLK